MKTMGLHVLIKSVYMVSVQLSLMLDIITILKHTVDTDFSVTNFFLFTFF